MAASSSRIRTSPSRKLAERAVARKEAELQVALDNMPGALAYTDDELNIVFCNDRYKDMYPVPRELFEPGRPYPDFLRHLAEHGYYGDGDVDALVAQRVQSLRKPAGFPLEDRTPDGRVYEVNRRRAALGGTVTVITDITRLKLAEEDLTQKEAQLHVALDNMPGALVYTDEELNIVFCNDRFAEMYPVPKELLEPGRPYPEFPPLSRRARILRRGRHRHAGRAPDRKPAKSHRRRIRRPHAKRRRLPDRPPQGRTRAAR